MSELREFPLRTASGLSGTVFRRARFLDRTESNRVRLDDGAEFDVPSSSLQVQPDGTFFLDDGEPATRNSDAAPQERNDMDSSRQAAAAAAEPARERAPAEPARERAPAEPAREYVDEQALFAEDVAVERVPVNRLVASPPETRQEGDTTIIPVLEEVITVQKRLLLREEVRITRRRTELRQPRRVVLNGTETRIVGADGREISQ